MCDLVGRFVKLLFDWLWIKRVYVLGVGCCVISREGIEFMVLEVDVKKVIIEEYVMYFGDIGFFEVQVVMLMQCIKDFIEYLKEYKYDYYLCCGLFLFVGQCCCLFGYFQSVDIECYCLLIVCFGFC